MLDLFIQFIIFIVLHFFCFSIQVSSTYIHLSYEMASRMKNSLDDHNRPGDYEATAICQNVIVDEISWPITSQGLSARTLLRLIVILWFYLSFERKSLVNIKAS